MRPPRLAAACALLVALVPSAARGGLRIVESGAGACPAAEAVARGVRAALPQMRVEVGPGEGEGEKRVKLWDLGPRFLVEVDGTERVFDDPARRCDERARAASVFLTLMLDMYAFEPPAPPGPGPGIDKPAPRPAPLPLPFTAPPLAGAFPGPIRPRWTRGVGIEVSVDSAVGLRTDAHVLLGAGARLVLGRRQLRVTLGLSYLAPMDSLAAGPDRVRQARLMGDLSLRYQGSHGPLAWAGELGWEAGGQFNEAPALGSQGTGGETGPRLAGRLGWRVDPRWEMFAGVEWLPLAYRSTVRVTYHNYRLTDREPGPAMYDIISPRFWFRMSVGAALTIL